LCWHTGDSCYTCCHYYFCISIYFYISITRSIDILSAATAEAAAHVQWVARAVSMAYPTILTQLCRSLFPLQSTHVRLVLLLPAYLHFYMLAGKRKSESKRENKNVNEDQVNKRNTESHALEVTLDVLISLTEVSKAPLLKGHRNKRFKSDKHSWQCWNNLYGCSIELRIPHHNVTTYKPRSGEDVGYMDQPLEPTKHTCIWSRHSREDKEFAWRSDARCTRTGSFWCKVG